MIVIQCGKPNAVEKRGIHQLRNEQGILLVNPVIPVPGDGRGRSRELDLLWISPRGVAVIEAKGTEQSGKLRPRANGDWEVDGAVAEFYGGSNPFGQARGGAQQLKRFLDEQDLSAGLGRIRAVALVVGRDAGIQVDQTAADLGDVVVADLDVLVATCKGVMSGSISPAWVTRLLTALDLPESLTLDADALAAEGFSAGPPPRTSSLPGAHLSEQHIPRAPLPTDPAPTNVSPSPALLQVMAADEIARREGGETREQQRKRLLAMKQAGTLPPAGEARLAQLEKGDLRLGVVLLTGIALLVAGIFIYQKVTRISPEEYQAEQRAISEETARESLERMNAPAAARCPFNGAVIAKVLPGSWYLSDVDPSAEGECRYLASTGDGPEIRIYRDAGAEAYMRRVSEAIVGPMPATSLGEQSTYYEGGSTSPQFRGVRMVLPTGEIVVVATTGEGGEPFPFEAIIPLARATRAALGSPVPAPRCTFPSARASSATRTELTFVPDSVMEGGCRYRSSLGEVIIYEGSSAAARLATRLDDEFADPEPLPALGAGAQLYPGSSRYPGYDAVHVRQGRREVLVLLVGERPALTQPQLVALTRAVLES